LRRESRRSPVWLVLPAGIVLAAMVAAGGFLARGASGAGGPPSRPAPASAPTTAPGAVADEAAELLARQKALSAPGRLYWHEGDYQPLRLTWSASRQVHGARGVFPHPLLPRRALLACAEGLMISEDAGRTWLALTAADAEKVGLVRDVAFSPEAPDTFYLACDAKGVWMTADGGKTFRRIGSRRNGLADDSTCAVCVYPGDPSSQTLLVGHGDAACGLSRSDDGGQTWTVIEPQHRVRAILAGPTGSGALFLIGSKKQMPDVQCVYFCSLLGESWQEAVRDVIPIDGTWPALRGGPFVATGDSGMYRLSGDGAFTMKVGPEGVVRWSSVGVTWGPTADSQIVYACEPTRLGMVASGDGFKTFSTHSAGLYTGSFVKEGAHIRAGADGQVFYAVVNDVLYVGRVRPGALAVEDVTVTPPVVLLAPQARDAALVRVRRQIVAIPKERTAVAGARRLMELAGAVRRTASADQIVITARVLGASGEANAVTVDLSRLGGSPQTPMFDDGRHGDGAAGDGVYGAIVPIDPRDFRGDPNDWRVPWPGRLALTVTARGADGAKAGAVGVLELLGRLESFTYWDEPPDRSQYACQGGAIVEIDGAAQAHFGKRCLKLTVAGGQWSFPLQPLGQRVSIAGQYALSFWIKTDANDQEELYVQVRDNPVFSMPQSTAKVPIVKENLIEGSWAGGQYRRVVVPLRRLLKDSPSFQPQLLQQIIFSGDGASRRSYWIDQVRFHSSPEDVKADRAVEGELVDE